MYVLLVSMFARHFDGSALTLSATVHQRDKSCERLAATCGDDGNAGCINMFVYSIRHMQTNREKECQSVLPICMKFHPFHFP